MKKILFFLAAGFVASAAIAQAPDSINYQAIARNSSGAVLANKTISIQFIIRQGSATGPHLMVDVHGSITTDAFGLFTTYIGSGTDSSSIAAINWGSAGPLFLEVDLDTTGTSSNWM